MSRSTYFRSFRRRRGDCGISQDCSRSQSPVCVVLSSLGVDNSGVYVYYCMYIVLLKMIKDDITEQHNDI